jgi:ankyrin repeat protein
MEKEFLGGPLSPSSSREKERLHNAASKGHLELIKLLIAHDKTIQINEFNKEGRTALNLAAYHGHVEVVKYLIEHGADIQLVDTKGRTALHRAALKGHVAVAEVLLEKDPTLLMQPNETGDLPIHIAARYNNHTDFIQFLLQKESTVQQGIELLRIRNKDEEGNENETLLHMAVSNGNKDMVIFFIEKGLDINATNARGETPLYYAVYYYRDSLEILQFLIQAKANLNLLTKTGDTPLHLAAYRGYHEVVSCLLRYGINPSRRNKYGEEPLHLGAYKCYIDNQLRNEQEEGKKLKKKKNREMRDYAKSIKHILLTRGAPNTPDKDGLVPLHLASQSGSMPVIESLLEHDAQLYATDHFQRTALHFAVSQHHFAVAKFLLEYEVKWHQKNKDSTQKRLCNMTDADGDTALHYLMDYKDKLAVEINQFYEALKKKKDKTFEPAYLATYHQNVEKFLETVVFLLNKGFKLAQRNKEGSTPFHIAITNFHPHDRAMAIQHARARLIEKLLMRSPPLAIPDKDGRYPIHNAVTVGDLNTTRLLLKKDIKQLYMTDKYHETLLHVASRQGNVELIEYIIKLYFEHNIDLDTVDKDGTTPLHMAVYYHCMPAIKCLLQAGANLYAQDKTGNSALHLAVLRAINFNGHLVAAQYLLEQDMIFRRELSESECTLQRTLKKYKHILSERSVEKKEKMLQKVLQEDFPNASVETLEEKCQLLADQLLQKGMLLRKRTGSSHLEPLYTLRNVAGETAVHVAVHNGYLSILQLLYSISADLHIMNDQQKTLLHIAAYKDEHLPIVEFLIQMGANLQICDDKGMTPFHIAIKHSCLNVARYLFRTGALVDTIDNDGWAPLHYAVDNNDYLATQFLLEHCNPKLDIRGQDYKTAFYIAAENGFLEIMRLLINAEEALPWSSKNDSFFPHLSPNMSNKLTPIHIAFKNGHLNIVSYLIEGLPDFTIVDGYNRTLMHYIAEYGKDDDTYINLARRLIDHGVDKEAKDKDGYTPLHRAARSNNVKFVEFLILNEANLDITNAKGDTPLHVAVRYNHTSVVQLILKLCPPTQMNLKMRNEDGASLLHIAAWKNNPTLVRLFVELGLKPDTKDKEGDTALHKAVSANNTEIVRLLLGMDKRLVYETNQFGETALCNAVKWNYIEIVSLLIEQDKDQIAIPNYRAIEPKEIAISKGNIRVQNILSSNEADARIQLIDSTPLQMENNIWTANFRYQVKTTHAVDPMGDRFHSDMSDTMSDASIVSSLQSFRR